MWYDILVNLHATKQKNKLMKRIRMFIARQFIKIGMWISPIYLSKDTEDNLDVLKVVNKKAKVVDMSPLIEL